MYFGVKIEPSYIDKNIKHFHDIFTAELDMSPVFISEMWSPYSKLSDRFRHHHHL